MCDMKCSYLNGNLLVLNSLTALDFFFFLDQTFSLLPEIAPLGNQAFPEIQETEMETAGEREVNYTYRSQFLKF